MRSVLKEIKGIFCDAFTRLEVHCWLFGLYNVHSISNVTEGGILGTDPSSGILVWDFTIILWVPF